VSRRLIIDTDPGIDDAMAIATAWAAPELDLMALTTVYGNHLIDITTANAQRVLDHLGGSDVPVIRGAARPLVRPRSEPATFVHGNDGLGDLDLPAPSIPPRGDRSAAHHIVEAAFEAPGSLTVAAIGPLTNLALALRLEPRLVDVIDQIVVMGGAMFVPGNVTPSAEANIWNDPEAAEIVCGSGLRVTMIGLDVTHQILATDGWLDRLSACDAPGAQLVCRTAPTYLRFHHEVDGTQGMFCHDVATIAYLLRPDLFETEPMSVRVVCDGFAAGATMVARRGASSDPAWAERPSVDVAVSVDAAGVLDLVESVLRLPAH
jgi:purine nucleosidase